MTNRPSRMLDINVLRNLMERLLVGAGCSRETASETATVFWEAELRGNPLQGLDHMPTLLRCLTSGIIRPDGRPEIVREGDAAVLVTGNRGPGPITGMFAADTAVKKAKASGAAVVGVIDSGDMYMIGYYVEQMARGGCIGFVASDSAPYAHATGGMERVLGTNPIGLAFPRGGNDPVVVDFATSAFSASRVRHALQFGDMLPADVALGPDGLPTREPKAAREGAFDTFGGHKGFGLSFSVALLSGVLMGGSVGKAMVGMGWTAAGSPKTVGRKGHFFLAIDPAAFGDAGAFHASADRYLAEIKGTKPAPGSDGVRVPGERSLARRAQSLREGKVPIYEFVWENTAALARELGVAMPA
ncbi:MAG: Ldh family oxidoreductase [Rhodospirillales bacterium]|nr:Ldh family oxidoreductase [Rhodospirillales bacterium]